MLAQIVDMVANAQRSRAPIQRVADAVAAWFVPLVIAAAVLTFIAWAIWGPAESRLAYAFVSAVAVLIIACPCALGLATPMSIMVGVGRGAKEGVLVKDAEVLEELEKIDTLVVDKTGTLTEGRPKLVEIRRAGRNRAKTNCCGWPRPSNRTASIRWRGRSSQAAKERGLVARERQRISNRSPAAASSATVDGRRVLDRQRAVDGAARVERAGCVLAPRVQTLHSGPRTARLGQAR